MRKHFVVLLLVTNLFIFSGRAFGSCGGHGSRHESRDRGSVGVGANVDLGGVGQRKREADPFATSGGDPVASHTQEKSKTKKKQTTVASSDPFSKIELTGPQAKKETTAPVASSETFSNIELTGRQAKADTKQ